MKKPKQFDHLMAKLAVAMEVAPGHAGTIIADAAKALHKAVKIAQAKEEWFRHDIIPTAGPRIGFMGRSLWRTGFENWEGRRIEREIYQTQGGALVALAVSCALDDDEGDRVTVHVAAARDDAAAQQSEIMEAWRWDRAAIDMAKALGWNTAVWID